MPSYSYLVKLRNVLWSENVIYKWVISRPCKLEVTIKQKKRFRTYMYLVGASKKDGRMKERIMREQIWRYNEEAFGCRLSHLPLSFPIPPTSLSVLSPPPPFPLPSSPYSPPPLEERFILLMAQAFNVSKETQGKNRLNSQARPNFFHKSDTEFSFSLTNQFIKHIKWKHFQHTKYHLNDKANFFFSNCVV